MAGLSSWASIVVNAVHGDAPDHEHAPVAVREAFDAALRRTEAAVRSSAIYHSLEHFQAKWTPVRVKRMRKNKNLEPQFDSIKSGNTLGWPHDPWRHWRRSTSDRRG
jgi:hypothetical protein